MGVSPHLCKNNFFGIRVSGPFPRSGHIIYATDNVKYIFNVFLNYLSTLCKYFAPAKRKLHNIGHLPSDDVISLNHSAKIYINIITI